FVAPVQRVEENRRSLELRNGRIPRIFRNNLAYEDDTNSQFACILRNFGLEHSFVHLQTAGMVNPMCQIGSGLVDNLQRLDLRHPAVQLHRDWSHMPLDQGGLAQEM